ncbi:MAG TPA: plasmid stabilization protein [Armatimonadota bacterium]|jgi:plasmid stabilization system protein ParE
MPRGDKSAYTGKQKRMAEHIEDSYKERGVSDDEAERRAWATVNKETGGGKLSGSGRARSGAGVTARTGGSMTSSTRPTADRSAAAKKGWQTRRSKVG